MQRNIHDRRWERHRFDDIQNMDIRIEDFLSNMILDNTAVPKITNPRVLGISFVLLEPAERLLHRHRTKP